MAPTALVLPAFVHWKRRVSSNARLHVLLTRTGRVLSCSGAAAAVAVRPEPAAAEEEEEEATGLSRPCMASMKRLEDPLDLGLETTRALASQRSASRLQRRPLLMQRHQQQ
jgi:hypothetical protein